jgi:hypothetical protein
MPNKTPPAAAAALHTPAGRALGVEATTLAAGDTIIMQNNGDTAAHVNITTPGTATAVALNSANNQAITLATGNNLLGPYDPGIFGSTVTITTATAVGTVALYHIPPRFSNGLRNPFEANPNAIDA